MGKGQKGEKGEGKEQREGRGKGREGRRGGVQYEFSIILGSEYNQFKHSAMHNNDYATFHESIAAISPRIIE